MGHEDDYRIAGTDLHPEVARGVGLLLRPDREQLRHGVSHWTLRARNPVRLDERADHALRVRNTADRGGRQEDRPRGEPGHAGRWTRVWTEPRPQCRDLGLYGGERHRF